GGAGAVARAAGHAHAGRPALEEVLVARGPRGGVAPGELAGAPGRLAARRRRAAEHVSHAPRPRRRLDRAAAERARHDEGADVEGGAAVRADIESAPGPTVGLVPPALGVERVGDAVVDVQLVRVRLRHVERALEVREALLGAAGLDGEDAAVDEEVRRRVELDEDGDDLLLERLLVQRGVALRDEAVDLGEAGEDGVDDLLAPVAG